MNYHFLISVEMEFLESYFWRTIPILLALNESVVQNNTRKLASTVHSAKLNNKKFGFFLFSH